MNTEDTRIPHVELARKVRQNVSKRLKARQTCVDDENAVSKKPRLLIVQDTRGTQVHRTVHRYTGHSRYENATNTFILV